MKDAVFKHRKTGGLYTVVARATASLAQPLEDNAPVGVRKTDLGVIVVEYPNIVVDHVGQLQSAKPLENGEEVIVYRGSDYRYWVRPLAEFLDGRFEPFDNRAACMMPPAWHFGAMGATD